MKTRKYIFRLMSFFVLFCVFTTQVSAWSVPEYRVTCEDQDSENDRPVFKQLTHETVVPHHDFSFGEINAFFQENTLCIFSKDPAVATSPIVAPASTYMAKLLEHHIAINAP